MIYPSFIVLWRLRAHWGLRTFHLPVIHPFSFHSAHNAEPDVTSLHYYVKQQQQQKSNRSVKCISQSLSCIHAQQQLKCNGQPFQWSQKEELLAKSSWQCFSDFTPHTTEKVNTVHAWRFQEPSLSHTPPCLFTLPADTIPEVGRTSEVEHQIQGRETWREKGKKEHRNI